MANTIDPKNPSLSRLNRYFENDSSKIPPQCPAIRGHAATMVRVPPKTLPPSGPPIPIKKDGVISTIDGAACKTSTWTYKHISAKNGGVSVIEKGARVRADKRSRKPLQKLNWKNSPWPKGFSPSRDYLDLDTRPPTANHSSDVSPRLAVKRISLLASHQQYKDAADFIHRLPSVTVRSALPDLPMETLVESMPLSLPVVEALFCTAGEASPDLLHVDRVVWQMVRFFAQQEECLTGDIRWEFCGPFVILCRDVLRVVARVHPTLRKSLVQRRKQLEKAIEGMGHHGLVGTSDESLTSLHEALKLEFEKVVRSYTAALSTLQELSNENKGHVSRGPAPIQASHQRQLSINSHDIQERLIKNKSLLNIVEPTLGNHSLDILLGILQRRIEHDKDSLFQFTQLRKESKDIQADAIVAPILMRYAHGIDQVLDMLREVMEESGWEFTADEDDGSDVSGYHSDSDSAIMMSGNSPYVTKHARFNFLTRSVRDRSRVGARSSLPMPPASTSGASNSALSSRMSSSGSSDTHSNRGSDPQEDKRGSPAPSSRTEDISSVLKAPSEAPSTIPADVMTELDALRAELTQARQTIRVMHEREKQLKENLSNQHSCPTSGKIMPSSSLSPSRQIISSQSKNTTTTLRQPDRYGPNQNNFTCKTLNHDSRNQRDFARSKSVVNLSEDNQTREDWSTSYSKEYPKGYSNNKMPVIKSSSSTDYQSKIDNLPRRTSAEGVLSTDVNKNFDRSIPIRSANISSRLENIALGDSKSSSLIRRYGNLYAQSRVETLDALDQLVEMRNASELKSKLVFSVVVLAFRSVSASATALRQDVRRILGVSPRSEATEQQPRYPKMANSTGDVTALESAMASVITTNVDSHDLSSNVEDVCQQIWATLYDYPGLKNCEGLLCYIKECVRVAWGLVNQTPPFSIEYEARTFRKDLHVRFHTSDAANDSVRTYLWPALTEGSGGPCVHKGVVIT